MRNEFCRVCHIVLWPFAMRHTCVRVKHARHQPNSRKRKKKKTPKHTHTHTTIRQMFDLDYVSPQVCACVRLVSTSWNNVSSGDHPSSTCSNHFWSRYRLQSNNRTHDITHTLFEMGIQNWKKQKLHHTCLFFFSFNKRIREWNPFLFLKAAALLLNFLVFFFFLSLRTRLRAPSSGGRSWTRTKDHPPPWVKGKQRKQKTRSSNLFETRGD